MAPNAPITAPDYKNLPHSHKLPVTHRDVTRTFNKLSRQSLISLAQQWLAKKNRDFCRPYLYNDQDEEDQDDLDQAYEPAHSYEELQEAYKVLSARKGGRKEVMDRILEGDWRTGISMYQLATAEIQHLLDHPSSLRWTAKRMAKIPNNKIVKEDMEVTNESEHLPRFQAQTFMMNLARDLTPLMKAHYLITRIKTLPITILRVYIHDSPYSSEASISVEQGSAADSARAVFFIWPNGSPFVYVSLATHLGQVVGDEGRHLRDVVLQAIPKAFSRPSSRYQLVPTNFTARSLSALLAYRGPGKSNAGGGGWSIFADHSFSQNALDFITTGKSDDREKNDGDGDTVSGANRTGSGRSKRSLDPLDTPEAKRRKEIAQGRFGTSAKPDDGHGIERFEVRIDDPFPTIPNIDPPEESQESSNQRPKNDRRGRPSLLDRTADEIEEIAEEDTWIPDVRVTFQGSHVFAGIRELVEGGIIDGEKMPGWMTGEAGVTIGSVKHGRIRTKGSVPGV